MRLSQDKLLLMVLLCSHVSIRTAVPVLLDNEKAGMNTIDSDHENHAQYQRSVPPQWTTDQQIDDILLTGSERLEVAQTITPTVEPRSRADHTWPNKTVYYTFGQTLSFHHRELFQQAMNLWADSTCIQFRRAVASWQDHIEFILSEDHGCSSYVGRKGGAQIVSMSDGCKSRSNAIHLVGHAIGLWHEHTRPDRDSYVEVLYDNINETDWDKFGKISQDQFNLVPDVGYDVESIMHYGPDDFTKNGGETLRVKDDAPLDYRVCSNLLGMGQRDQLSYLDKLKANKLYSCQEQVFVLEMIGRNCILGPPIDLVSTSSEPPPVAVRCPHSSLLPQLSAPSTSSTHRLKTGNVITLQLQHSSTKGVRCAPKCRPKECHNLTPDSVCHTINFQFEVVAIGLRDSDKINSGNKVALRSRCNPSKWLDCSNGNSGNECSITRCSRCIGSACYDASYVTPCKSHHFRVYGVGRQEDKVLNTHYELYFRPADNDDDDGDNPALSCYKNDMCKFTSGRNFTNRGEMLDESEKFAFTILTET